MFGLTDHIIVTVVNALANEDKRKTNFFDTNPSIHAAAIDTIHRDTTGNPHQRSDIQKQAYLSERVKTVRQAYGLTGTKFNTHTPYINGKQVGLDDLVTRDAEIILVKNGLKVQNASIEAGKHRIIPMRTNRFFPTRLFN